MSVHKSELVVEECVKTETIEELQKTLDSIKADLDAIRELLEAWNAAKGAVKVIYVIGTVIKWLVVTGVALSAITFFLHNGTWPTGGK